MDWGIAKLHPIVLLCVFGAWLFAMFFYAQSFYGLLLLGGNLLWYFWRLGKRGVTALKWYFLLAGITVVFNLFFYRQGREILFYFLGRPILKEGLVYGGYMGALLFSFLLFWQIAAAVFPRDKWLWLWRRILPQTAMVMVFSGGIFTRCKKNMTAKWQILTRGHAAEIAEKRSLAARCREIGDSLYAFAGWTIQWGMETVDSVNSRGYGLRGGGSKCFAWQRRDTVSLSCLFIAGAALVFCSYYQWAVGNLLFILCLAGFFAAWEGKEGRVWRSYTM